MQASFCFQVWIIAGNSGCSVDTRQHDSSVLFSWSLLPLLAEFVNSANMKLKEIDE
jgi:hypothetical protein